MPENERVRKTEFGEYSQDKYGFWHYKTRCEGLDVHNAAGDALANYPMGPSWFWLADSPCPIQAGDELNTLVRRWLQWNTAWIQDPSLLRNLLVRMSAE